MVKTSQWQYRDDGLRPRQYKDRDRERWEREDNRMKKDREIERDYRSWEERQRHRRETPGWYLDDDPRPPRQHDVPPARRPGNLQSRDRW
jgi:hypothetical protein